jgi:ABC-type multidrug transport system ATPase subunit
MNTIITDRTEIVVQDTLSARAQPLTMRIEGVGKQYNTKNWGLRDFTLELAPGLLGLLGPNGAGKSTLMRILATITKATEGSVTWNGTDIAKSPDDLRAVLGYLPQDFGVYPNLNAVEFLEYMAAIKGLDSRSAKMRIDELLAQTPGMKQSIE